MLTDRFIGSIVGLAVADALGAPVEGLSPNDIVERFGRISGWVHSPADPARWRLSGLHTDDTQQALIVTETLAENGFIEPNTIVEKMIDLSAGPRTVPFGAYRGSGRNFRFSVQWMQRDRTWNSGMRNTAGIGASMRVAPVGLFFAGDDGAVRENAALAALVTHSDPRAVIAACAVAYLAGRAAWTERQPLIPEEVHAATLDFIHRTEAWFNDRYGRLSHPDVRDSGPQFGAAFEALRSSWTQAPETVLPRIRDKASELSGYDVGLATRGFALAGVVAAIYFFLRYREDYRSAVLAALNAGGDTDSVAAIAGALCGAAGGESAIPAEWREKLIAYDQIRLRALALSGQEFDEVLWRPLAGYELELTLEEDRRRREFFPPELVPAEYVWETPPERHQRTAPAPDERERRVDDARRSHRPRRAGGRSR